MKSLYKYLIYKAALRAGKWFWEDSNLNDEGLPIGFKLTFEDFINWIRSKLKK